MPELWRSVLLGTSGLSLVLLVALLLTCGRRRPNSDRQQLRRASSRVLVAVLWHSANLFEEWATGFQRLFPEFLGLTPWADSFFVPFNLVCMVGWLLGADGLRRGQRWALWPSWFLALGFVVNAVAHPAMALAVGGYFPGLWTSPICGWVGVVLLRHLITLTAPAGS